MSIHSTKHAFVEMSENEAGIFRGHPLARVTSQDGQYTLHVCEKKRRYILDEITGRPADGRDALEITAAIRTGHSGAPVVNGAGASAMACTNLFKNSGVQSKNIVMLDRKRILACKDSCSFLVYNAE